MPRPEQEQLKAHLTLQIYRTIEERGLTQTQAAALLGLKQPHVSLRRWCTRLRCRSRSWTLSKYPIAL